VVPVDIANIDNIVLKNVNELNPAAYNPRHMDEKEFAKLKLSIAEYGLVQPIVWNERTGNVVGGHQRLKACIDIGLETVPVVVVDYDEQKEKGANIALNKIEGEFDTAKLKDLLEELDTGDFDMWLTGYDEEELENLMTQFHVEDEGEIFGSDQDENGAEKGMAQQTLAERFGVSPFTILDTRRGQWQERKKAWINLGLKSEVGRGAGDDKTQHGLLLANSSQPIAVYKKKNEYEEEIGHKVSWDEFYAKYPDAAVQSGTSIFDPVLCELLYLWFSPPGGKVLDPFAGGSVRGIVAGRLGRVYHGIDLRPEQIEANRQQLDIQGIEQTPTWYAGDSSEMDEFLPKDLEVDFVFSCPPYYDLEVYSDSPQDLSNMDYEEFIRVYGIIIKKAVSRLKDNRFACFVVGDVRDKQGYYRNFVSHTIQAFIDAGMSYYNEAILINMVGSLAVRVGRQFSGSRKLGKLHQNVLVFYKGDPKEIRDTYGEIELDDLLEEELVPEESEGVTEL
jgi:DNA modification methylase